MPLRQYGVFVEVIIPPVELVLDEEVVDETPVELVLNIVEQPAQQSATGSALYGFRQIDWHSPSTFLQSIEPFPGEQVGVPMAHFGTAELPVHV